MIPMNIRQGCFGNMHAKIFEIILIVAFIISIILLIINFAITFWVFKLCYALLLIEIGLLISNALSLIFSIILRIWRSNKSVIDKNLSSSLCIANFSIFLVIINILLSIAVDILFYFIYSYFGFCLKILESEDPDDELYEKFEENLEIMKKIMVNDFNDKLFDEDEEDVNENINKIKTLRIVAWIPLNINIIIQAISLLFIFILIRRIRSKSDYGLPQIMNNQSVQKRILGNQNVVVMPYNQYDINQISQMNPMDQYNKDNSKNSRQKPTDIIASNSESEDTRMKEIKTKKKEDKHKNKKKDSNKKNH